MKRERKRKSKKVAYGIFALGVVLFLCGFAVLIVGAFKQSQGQRVDGGRMCLLAFSPMILSVILQSAVLKDTMVIAAEEESERCKNTPLSHLKIGSQGEVLEAFQRMGFREMDGGYLTRKISTFWKGSIHSYVRCVPGAELLETVREELQRIDLTTQTEKVGNKCVCFYLFLSKSGVSDTDLDELREIAADFLIRERVSSASIVHTCIPVLLDTVEKRGYYLDHSKGIAVYAYGCRRLQTWFSQKEIEKDG